MARTRFTASIVSIRAPVKERPKIRLRRTLCQRFNPRSREGATPVPQRSFQNPSVSIRAPVKERPCCLTRQKYRRCFNPRSREGATYRLIDRSDNWNVSIRAPVKERRKTVLSIPGSMMFQSALP